MATIEVAQSLSHHWDRTTAVLRFEPQKLKLRADFGAERWRH